MDPDPASLEGVVLTHAHLDHSGYLPRLCKDGFRGRVLATDGMVDLCRILLRDAAKLEEENAAFANETGYSRHKPALPLFTEADVDLALARMTGCARHSWIDLGDGLSLRFLRAGHIIGASYVQLAVDTPSGAKTVTFSGDVGNSRSFLMRAPEPFPDTDLLVVESTYGDRLQVRASALDSLAAVVKRTVSRGGVLVIPAFAVGRAQELTYMLRLLEDRGRIPSVPVVLDSPMAAAATEVCLRHPEDHVLESAFHGAEDAFRPHLFDVAASPDQSMLACMRDGPMIVISASGMLNGGRVLHHLKRRLPDARNTVLFTGYQAEGTKGRYLQEVGAASGTVRIHHADVAVAAEIVTLSELSSHADQQDLVDLIERMPRLPTSVLINHGAPAAQSALAWRLRTTLGVEARPVFGCDRVEL
jgi:metallo-beta-lactamase family protein